MTLRKGMGSMLASCLVASCLLPDKGGSMSIFAAAGGDGFGAGTGGQPASNPSGIGGNSSGGISGTGRAIASGGTCPTGSSTSGGGCNCGTGGTSQQCQDGFADCANDGLCTTDLSSDPLHCGSCSASTCPYPVCRASACANPECYGICTTLDSSLLNNDYLMLQQGNILGFPVTLHKNDQVVSLGAVTTMVNLSTNGVFQVALYSDLNNLPYENLINTGDHDATEGVVEEVLGSAYTIPSDANYWVMMLVRGKYSLKIQADFRAISFQLELGSLPTPDGGFVTWPSGGTWSSCLATFVPAAIGIDAVGVVPHLFIRFVPAPQP